MTKVYPNAPPTPTPTPTASPACDCEEDPLQVLTVWNKSLLFNCKGYTVFDSNGNLVFRVDNYMSGSGFKAEILLMDAAGEPLLTIRRKRLSLGDNWMVYDGEKAVNPRFSAKKHVNILNSKCLAYVTSVGSSSSSRVVYQIEGSYAQRSCVVYDERRRKVAEIKQKEAAVKGAGFGVDVFRLIVNQPGIEAAEAMALVILLDQMFGSSRRFTN
ncbi:protein LURP-one-related 8 [Tripterygium wilfordii]|uniref:Protein LURP-one-related 8 n=1 Tax=Tripterygium wilfordii TaxID=458696 RepID=A0A7J7DNB3_TRIWF|nr:protein LURP-one-related 8-like [Tripterygium wilfordii]KAF5747704.1 protein LURP-one-related 8 [Tripterygium wilfordii]